MPLKCLRATWLRTKDAPKQQRQARQKNLLLRWMQELMKGQMKGVMRQTKHLKLRSLLKTSRWTPQSSEELGVVRASRQNVGLRLGIVRVSGDVVGALCLGTRLHLPCLRRCNCVAFHDTARTNSEALWHILRTKPLRPPKSEDNYDMSSAGDPDMTEEERAQHELDLEDRRVTKQSPRWCENYLELVHQQKDWDPDTVPPCDLDSVFPDALYMELNLQRTYKKRRGSSANWKKDQLKPDEMANYKRKLGLKKAFVPETDASLLMEQGEMRRLNKTATDKPSKSRKSKNKRQGEVPAICQFE
eukprot:g9198.t1